MDSIDIEKAIAQLDVYKKCIALDGGDTNCFDIAFDIMRQHVTDPVDRVTIKEYIESFQRE